MPQKLDRLITAETPCTLREVARYVGIGVATIYEKVAAGYRIQYPAIRRTTPAHFLAWAAEVEHGAPPTPCAAHQRTREIQRLHTTLRKPRLIKTPG